MPCLVAVIKMVSKVENISDEQLEKIRKLVGEAFVTTLLVLLDWRIRETRIRCRKSGCFSEC